ncbi:hypothetical protein EHS25_000537 [Saitozyma podzolica]|uniref:Uncharacterized protein n=1 Tax=Saitozyma podzolica TaxID=1890683 RepID=A0A427YWN7_9TREE|nr:hypothetical protein EHS25_000537 [Saitozyma podzolica]
MTNVCVAVFRGFRSQPSRSSRAKTREKPTPPSTIAPNSNFSSSFTSFHTDTWHLLQLLPGRRKIAPFLVVLDGNTEQDDVLRLRGGAGKASRPALLVRNLSTQLLIGDPLQSKFPKKSEASLVKKGQLTLAKFFSKKEPSPAPAAAPAAAPPLPTPSSSPPLPRLTSPLTTSSSTTTMTTPPRASPLRPPPSVSPPPRPSRPLQATPFPHHAQLEA